MLNVIPLCAFSDNYIWLISSLETGQTAIVDPGDAQPVFAALEASALTPCAILITHHHGDHIGGIRQLLSRYDMPVYGPANEHIPAITTKLHEGDEVVIDGIGARFQVLDFPGHTAGHIGYVGHGMLFCGDTLFSVGCGRLFEGTAEQMYGSLEKIRALPKDTKMYCAHEYTLDNIAFARVVEPNNPDLLQYEVDSREMRSQDIPTVPSALGLEKRINPFLRSHVPNVIKAAEKFAGRSLTKGDEIFGCVRYWKDTLD